MATFIIYAIRWAVTLTLLYSLYRLLLQRETFHRLNRAVLLTILVLSPLLPLIPLHTDEPTTFDEVLTRIEGPLLSLSTSEDVAGDALAKQENKNAASGLWVRYCAYIYIIGIAVALTIYLFRLLTLARLLRRCQRISHSIVPKDVHLMLDMRIKEPSSWMHWIFIGPIDLKQNAETVLRHELAHVRMRHSWDVILCDLTCRFLWCLPFVWMLRQDLVDVHEFQADEAVLQRGVTLEDYEHLLLRKAVQTQFLPIMNTLRHGALKKRFAMMYSNRSSNWSRLKLLYLLPAIGVALAMNAKTVNYQVSLHAVTNDFGRIVGFSSEGEPSPDLPLKFPVGYIFIDDREVTQEEAVNYKSLDIVSYEIIHQPDGEGTAKWDYKDKQGILVFHLRR